MTPKRFPWRTWTALAVSGPLCLAFGWLAGFAPAGVEAVYARGLYPWIARLLAGLQAWCPLSVMELLLYAALLGLPTWAVLGYRRGAGFWSQAGRGALRLAGLGGAAIALAMVLWGFHYRRQPFAAQAGWTVGAFAPAELEALAGDLRGQLIALDAQVAREVDGTLRLEDAWALLRTAGEGYRRLPGTWTVHHSGWARPKRMLWPRLLSATLTGGVFAPWTGEAQVNGELPACSLPFTACHELAHQKGFAREDEANFLGYAAALAHPDLRFAYSATLAAFQEVASRLPAERRRELLKDLPPGVLSDWKAQRAFFLRHVTPVSQASQRVYEGYLKSQGMADGLRSYGRFLDLMLAQRRAAGGFRR